MFARTVCLLLKKYSRAQHSRGRGGDSGTKHREAVRRRPSATHTRPHGAGLSFKLVLEAHAHATAVRGVAVGKPGQANLEGPWTRIPGLDVSPELMPAVQV